MAEAAESVGAGAAREGRAPRLMGIFAAWRLQAYGYLLAALYAVLLLGVYRAGNWLVHAGMPIYTDFTQQWIAARQALHGNIALIYDPARFVGLQRAVVGPRDFFYGNWPYPPIFFLFLAPFALLPYAAAFLSWNVVTVGGCIAVVWLITRRMPAIALVLASPFTAWNFQSGQNGFLTASLFGAALYFLEERPLLAGLFIGLLTYKPQWGLLIPVALLAGKQWRAIASAAATALLLAGLSLAAFGASAWLAFPHELLAQGSLDFPAADHVVTLRWGQGYIQTVYGLVRGLHGGGGAAWLLQAIAAAAAAAVVWRVWRSPARYGLKAATLSAAAFLATPYDFAYDFAALAIPLAFLAADQMRCGLLRGEQTVLLALFGASFALLVTTGSFPFGPLVVIALLALILRRVRRPVDESPGRNFSRSRVFALAAHGDGEEEKAGVPSHG
jgi:arabinofuranan 3-O-arabinosyltransferase